MKKKLERMMVLIYADGNPVGRAEEKCNSTCQVESDFLKHLNPCLSLSFG